MDQTTVHETVKTTNAEKQFKELAFPIEVSQETVTEFADFDERRLIRRIDFVLIPWLSLLYLLCFLDRVGIGNARLYGLESDLGISDSQYLLALSLFFVPYALLETPSNLVLKKLRPSIWLPTIMTLWGITTTCLGLIENFAGLLSLRILLGLFEAGFFPGVTYYLSCWYKRHELGIRVAIFTSAVTCSGAFGGLLAAAISNMEGVGGKGAWSWIFILEGSMTVVAGLASFFIIQDFPESARFLSDCERAFVIHRLKEDGRLSAGGEQFRWKNVKESLTDYKTWLSVVSGLGVSGPIYAFALFLPSIIRQLGYTSTRANLLTVPVYIVACVFSCCINYIADRLKKRGHIAMIMNIITGTGYVILLCSRKPALSYFAMYVAAIGIFPGAANHLTWVANNIEGSYKRAVTMALTITCGNLTGIVSSNTYRQHEAPWYPLGLGITLGFVAVGFIAATSLHVLLRKENARRDRGERDEVISNYGGGDPKNGVYDSIEAARRDKGDKWSGFRYVT